MTTSFPIGRKIRLGREETAEPCRACMVGLVQGRGTTSVGDLERHVVLTVSSLEAAGRLARPTLRSPCKTSRDRCNGTFKR